jgi:dihydrodipicolinate synthase/N-acetylneuraminate lyase
MNYEPSLAGVVPIVPTPFMEDEEIDEGALRDLIEFAVSCRVGAVCLPAYASEYYKLTDEERVKVVQVAIQQAAGRLKVVAQANSPSLKIAAQLAGAYVAAGADVVSIAVPRQFQLSEASLKDYLSGFLVSANPAPVLIQDYNPGGPSLSVNFVSELHREHTNFQYLKLEESLSAGKVSEIISATQGEIGLFEGWGGLYAMELIPAGIAGIMPGLALADLLQVVFLSRKKGATELAFKVFERVMPQIFYSLQNMELFHYAEKELLMARGILKNSRTRKAAFLPDRHTEAYIAELNDRILRLLSEKV